MNNKHLSTQFDAELSGISTRVLEMGGMVESQVARAIYALTHFSGEVASDVLMTEERVNTLEMDIDRDLSNNSWFDKSDELTPWRWTERVLARYQHYLHFIQGLGG